jgi:hypothetical protein
LLLVVITDCIFSNVIRSAIDDSLGPKVENLESEHNKDFAFTLDLLNRYKLRNLLRIELLLTSSYNTEPRVKIYTYICPVLAITSEHDHNVH